MKKFRHYVAFRENAPPAGRVTDKSVVPVLEKIVKVLWDRYHQETKEFIAEIGKNDPEVRDLLDRAEQLPEEPSHSANDLPPEANPNASHVVPPQADMPSGSWQ